VVSEKRPSFQAERALRSGGRACAAFTLYKELLAVAAGKVRNRHGDSGKFRAHRWTAARLVNWLKFLWVQRFLDLVNRARGRPRHPRRAQETSVLLPVGVEPWPQASGADAGRMIRQARLCPDAALSLAAATLGVAPVRFARDTRVAIRPGLPGPFAGGAEDASPPSAWPGRPRRGTDARRGCPGASARRRGGARSPYGERARRSGDLHDARLLNWSASHGAVGSAEDHEVGANRRSRLDWPTPHGLDDHEVEERALMSTSDG
jgi:hypothetical protein